MNGLRHALRNLRREWRLPEWRTLIAALLLAVIAPGTVSMLSARIKCVLVTGAGAQKSRGITSRSKSASDCYLGPVETTLTLCVA